MVERDPSLVILSATIAILGCFTASVMTSGSDIPLAPGETRPRLFMAAMTLGGAIWAAPFVGLLALRAPVNFAYNPAALAFSAAAAFFGTATALLLLRRGGGGAKMPVAIAVLGVAIAATQYLGLGAVAGRWLRLNWFLVAVSIAVSLQVAGIVLWFLFRRRGVLITLLGAAALGIGITATHYVSVASAQNLAATLAGVPPTAGAVSERYLAWSAAIMMYLLCSICLCIFVVVQFREEIQ